jgi:hypothetical protein
MTAEPLWTYDPAKGLISMAADHFMADCYTLYASPVAALDAAAAQAALDLAEAKMDRARATSRAQLVSCDSAIKNKSRILARIRGIRSNLGL